METTNTTLPEYGMLIQSRTARPEHQNRSHSHNHPSLIYVISGSGKCQYGKQSHFLEPNTAILLDRGTNHQFTDKPKHKMTVFSLYFQQHAHQLNSNIIKYLFASAAPFGLPPYYAKTLRRLFRQLLHEQNQKPPGYKMAMQQLLSIVLLNLYRAHLEISGKPKLHTSTDGTNRVRTVLDYVSRAYFEQISLSEASELANISQRQFSNICKQLTGKSFVQFLNEIRTNRAKYLLNQTNLPVAAIAFEVGYEELSTFYRAFRKHQGRSPLDPAIKTPTNTYETTYRHSLR